MFSSFVHRGTSLCPLRGHHNRSQGQPRKSDDFRRLEARSARFAIVKLWMATIIIAVTDNRRLTAIILRWARQTEILMCKYCFTLNTSQSERQLGNYPKQNYWWNLTTVIQLNSINHDRWSVYCRISFVDGAQKTERRDSWWLYLRFFF